LHSVVAGPLIVGYSSPAVEGSEMGLAVFVTLVGGLAALLYFVTGRRGMSPDEPEHERDKNQRLFRDAPPPW
jgi:hypothetical protein